MAKALIAYTTRIGTTRLMAESIAEGIRGTGTEVKVVDAHNVTSESDIAGYDAYLFGSPTYEGDMTHEMKALLLIAARVNLKGKIGGAFGSYGWSGEAPKKIHETMEDICGMEMAAGALMIKVPIARELLRQASQSFGREIGQKIQSQDSVHFQ